MNRPPRDERVARAVAVFAHLTRENLASLAGIYAADAHFRDPFNDVRGFPAIESIFDDMFVRLADCRFEFLDVVCDDDGALLTWDMHFRFRSYRPDTPQVIHGATHLKFDATGRIADHRDYWDAADELYAKLPLIGPLIRYLKRKMA
jgi:steroid delta-isomerase